MDNIIINKIVILNKLKKVEKEITIRISSSKKLKTRSYMLFSYHKNSNIT